MKGRTAQTGSDDARGALDRQVQAAGILTRSLAGRALSARLAAREVAARSEQARAAGARDRQQGGVALPESGLVSLPDTWTRDLRASLRRTAQLTEAIGFLEVHHGDRRELTTAGAGEPVDTFLREWDGPGG